MNRSIISVLAFALCLSSGDLDHNGIVDFNDLAIFADNWLRCGDDGGDLTEQNDVAAVMIVLTKLEITHQTLELGYKIKNGSDHDVWVCDSVCMDYGIDFEAYLAEDARTLVMRKLLDVSPEILWVAIPVGRYVRLRAGQERTESLSLTVPVRPQLVYIGQRASAEYATCLVLEIGFYNEDLPGLIRSIIEVAERLGCAPPTVKDYDSDIMRRYFSGLLIYGRFGGLSQFDESHQDVSEEFVTAYTDRLLGEQVLRIVVDNLYIPYQGYIPLTSRAAKGQGPGKIFETRPQKRTRPVDGEGSMHCEYFFQ